jgi:iron-sulfur cluster insertion protein
MSIGLPESTPTTAPAQPATPPINLTEKAAAKVKQIVSEEQQKGGVPERIYLRVRVVGGGCSGFQHKLDLDPNVNPKIDDVFEMHGVGVVIDKRSALYLGGAVVDYHDELHRSGFSVSNPQAKTTCGCGSSFSM